MIYLGIVSEITKKIAKYIDKENTGIGSAHEYLTQMQWNMNKKQFQDCRNKWKSNHYVLILKANWMAWKDTVDTS